MSVALLCTLLSGCGALPGQSLLDAAPLATLPHAVQTVLEQEPAGSRFRLPQSPWGAGVVIALQESYPAASGRTCRRIVIDPEGESRLGLACRLADGNWIESRVLHDNGRPLLRPSLRNES